MDATGAAVVTGASRGLGRAIAVALAGAGFDVVATMRDPEDGRGLAAEVAGTAGSLTVGRLDVTQPETIRLPDGLRVLVNNAGTEDAYLPVEAVPIAQWRAIFETNLFGLVEVTRRAIPLLRAAGGGVICNVTSSSLLAGVPFYSAYRASKAAVEALGESLRAEVGPFGIRVVEILPGPVATDMLANSGREPEAVRIPGYEAMAREFHEARSAIAPLVTPAEAAAAAVCRAVLADGGPLRWACDELGTQLLDAWRADPDGALGAR